ncbi:DUF1570 domain-containing protein [Lysobacter sp. CA199]|uniref:DUF1570 domain-containing protein n=1 Tax=Lysobacter sp. CA199 TaxID=3455608 RepID=UPI003F8D3717
MQGTLKLASILGLTLAACAACGERQAAPPKASVRAPVRAPAAPVRLPTGAQEHRSEHYAIFSTATPERTAQVAAAVESLYRAYAGFFRWTDGAPPQDRLKLILYRDRAQFSQYNTSMPWAEAYYRKPYCHAYYADRGENPYHWMLHEATHQLNAERAGMAAPRWINEGLATYFGTSVLENGVLHPGRIDPQTYPIWWLDDLALSGSLQNDLQSKRLIELRKVIDGSGPAIGGGYLNVYYLQFWSLTHFLFHGQDGKYAGAYRKLMRGRGTVEEFEATIGPIARIQQEWYDYLLEKQAEQALAAEPVQHAPVQHVPVQR